jgi:hypothetical protein
MLKPTFQWGMHQRTGRTCVNKCTFISDIKLVEAPPTMLSENEL